MRIFLVDDELHLLNLLDRRLRQMGHETVLSLCSAEALEDGEWRGCDAIITDIDMPFLNGVEFARDVRAQMPQMPILFCSGSSPEGDRVQSARTIAPVLAKPWRVEELHAAVSALASCQAKSAA